MDCRRLSGEEAEAERDSELKMAVLSKLVRLGHNHSSFVDGDSAGVTNPYPTQYKDLKVNNKRCQEYNGG